ncbi:MAG: phosphoglycerate dehydrogenase, partial [Actinomycetota bacterium]
LARMRERFEVDVRTGMSRDELIEVIGDYDALVIRSATKVDAGVIQAGRNLKVIGRAGVGVDNVDVEAATKQGVLVVNAPQSNITSAAEHAVALLLAQLRNIPAANEALKQGRWERSKYSGVELHGKTVGILGLGRIGSLVAQRLAGFGVRLIAYDPYVSKERASQMGVEVLALEEVLAQSDIITVHLPKNPETLGLIGAKELAACKKGVRIVNAARGGIMDEAALAEAVASGQVGGAAVDVFAAEPTTESPLFGLDNVVVTPHLGASTAEAQDKAGTDIADNVRLALMGEFVPAAVNIKAGPVSDRVRPFLSLGDKLGRLYTAVAERHVGEVQIEYAGQIAEEDTRVLKLAVLRGLFAAVVHEPVTFVNASLLAKDRGVEVKEVATTVSLDWVNVLTVRGMGTQGPVSVSGTIVGPKNQERIVGLNGFELDMATSAHVAFLRYQDVPGVIGKVGTTLGEARVNIATMEVSRRKQGGEALMAVTVDSALAPEVIDDLRKAVDAFEVKYIELPDGSPESA